MALQIELFPMQLGQLVKLLAFLSGSNRPLEIFLINLVVAGMVYISANTANRVVAIIGNKPPPLPR